MTADRIEKQIVLKAPRSKVWKALTDARQFSVWFGVDVEGDFAPGREVWAVSNHPGYEGRFSMTIDEMVPDNRFSWRWHPGAPGKDYGAEPPTLVVFELSDVQGGTLLKVVETGFSALPMARQASAYQDNEGGWATQMRRIEEYVGRLE
jgi:uncharacterized protein YndB with AHSA1/START domain